jgi:hypothetical protein
MTLADLNAPTSYTLLLEGNGGIAGSAKGSAKVRLSEANGGTLINYQVEAQVGGRMAQLGGPVIDAAAKDFAGRFFRSFGEAVSGKKAPAPVVSQPSVAATRPQLPAAPGMPTYAAPSGGLPFGWILAVLVAGVVGYQLGRDPAAVAGAGWAGISIGLLLILVAAAGVSYGRRLAAPTIVVDPALLRRLTEGSER